MERNQKKNIINLIFDAGRGECAIRSREAVTGEPYGDLPTARRQGYVFDGWYTQADVNGDKITSGDTVTAEQDVTLYAMYTKLQGAQKKKKVSSLRTQRRALVALLCTVVVLIVGVVVAKYLASLAAPYTDADGRVYTSKKIDGEYTIVDEDGNALEVNQEGYYGTEFGTLLELDPTTGEISEYAIVYVEGSEEVGSNSRILMYAQIKQSNVKQISVTNQYGSYTFYTDENNNVQIKGFENDLVQYDKELYAYLCVGAGYPLTLRKLDTEEVLKRGYAEYGLEEEMRVDEEGNEYLYKPSTFTITSKDGVSHTVIIGDMIVSEAGYYCKLADSEENKAVYVMSSSSYGQAILQPVENLVTPMIVYPMSITTYYNVEDFIIGHYTDELDEEGNREMEIDVAFEFIPLNVRTNTMYTSESYEIIDNLFRYKYDGYRLDNDMISVVLQNLYTTNFTRVCKLGLTDEAIEQYGLDDPKFFISYTYLIDSDEDGTTDAEVENLLFISERTPQGTYYVMSGLCNTIAEVDQSSFYFLENDLLDWLNQYIIWINLAYIQTIDINSPNYDVTFTLDNSASDQSSNVSSANIKLFINGEEPDYVVYKTSQNTGKQTAETPVYNFRQFYKSLLYASIGGLTDEGHIKLTEEEMAALRADESNCQLELTLVAEDIATVTNPNYFTENNQKTLVYRFYRYSEGKSYLTINGEGEFFVDASFVEKLISDARKVEDGILVVTESKT
ncbi:MAG: DUF4340 domain-containing protein [Clostridia bacterium]|nr:DUF4340 domain-containing protein [Clostridia bacterium]